jgi:hypothetical protein
MNYTFKPCFSHNYDNYVKCIQSINEYEISVPGFSGRFVEPKKIVFNETPSYQAVAVTEEIKQQSILQKILTSLKNLISSTIWKINDLLS